MGEKKQLLLARWTYQDPAKRTDCTAITKIVKNDQRKMSVLFQNEGKLKSVLFPTATSIAFRYPSCTGYESRDRLVNCAGYWLKLGSRQRTVFTGQEGRSDTLQVSLYGTS